ncbi:MAG: LexA family transcriptional regulator, partial [Neisseriaceae bacterium]|nr:LexA family transcriptional regulator [Neisseriaceae bacterium]
NARKNAGITQETLALELNFANKSSVSAMEIGKNKPSYETLLKISQICGYPLPYQDTNIVPVYELATNFEIPLYDYKTKFPDDETETILIPKFILQKQNIDNQCAICLCQVGTSMQPVIPDGSKLIIDTSLRYIADGKIYAVWQDDILRIRTLYRLSGNKVRLKSFNDNEFPEEIVDINTLRIIGKVSAWIAFD